MTFISGRKCVFSEIVDVAQDSASLSAHPLYVPTLLLQHHLYRSQEFCTVHMEDEYNKIQSRLGATRAGRMHAKGEYKDPVGEKTISETRVILRDLTGELNTFMTEIIWYCKGSEWHVEYAELLRKAYDDVSKLPNKHYMTEQRGISDAIQYLSASAKGLQRQNVGAKERAEADFNVLYSITAQLDNRLNAKMSALANRDSIAMKTLAFITTLFLPGTFVATLFSMDMFNWQASLESDSSHDSQIISPLFWIYWVVTVPLTVIIAFSWQWWWKWEKRRFDQDVRIEIENIEARKLRRFLWKGGK